MDAGAREGLMADDVDAIQAAPQSEGMTTPELARRISHILYTAADRIWWALFIGSFLGGIVGAATVSFVGDWVGTLAAVVVGVLIGVGVMIWVRVAE
jgi:hypothetical protein